MDTNTKRMYRKPVKGVTGVKKCIALSAATMKGLDAIRAAFQSRYPLQSYPTLSATLELVINQSLERLQDPEELAAEVAFFKRKYNVTTNEQEQV